MTLLAAGNGTALWYLTRGSGVAALLLLTTSVLLGVVGALRWRGERWPRFAVNDVHRNLTLLSIVFVAVHVVTTVADGYAPIGFVDAIVPFLSPYRPLWLGLGAVAFDLLLALVATSLLRGVVPARLWRGLHWLAYAAWPVALLHSLGTGSDVRTGWLQGLGLACLAAVALAALARVVVGGGVRGARLAGAAAAIALPLALLVWDRSGPLRTGWARRAGTPASILARKSVASPAKTVVVAAQPPTPFASRVAGTLASAVEGRDRAVVDISLRLAGSPGGAVRIDLRGFPSGDGVTMTESGVSFVPASTRSVYKGRVVSLDGSDLTASVRDAAGDRLLLRFSLALDPDAGSASGSVRASAPGGSA